MSIKLKTTVLVSIFLMPIICFSQKTDSCFRFIGINTGIGLASYNFGTLNKIVGQDGGAKFGSPTFYSSINFKFNARNFSLYISRISSVNYEDNDVSNVGFEQKSAALLVSKDFITKNTKFGISPQLGFGESNFDFVYRKKNNAGAFTGMLANEKSVILDSYNNYFLQGGLEAFHQYDKGLKMRFGFRTYYSQYLMPVKWRTLDRNSVADMPLKNLSFPSIEFFVSIN